MKKLLVLLLCLAMVVTSFGCAKKAEEAPAAAPAAAPATEAAGEESKFDGQIYVGMLYAQTGNATYLGDCDYHAVLAAATEINNEGGIMGKEIVLVSEDEGETVDSSVKAMQKLLEDERLVAICGTLYSPRAIAAAQYIEEREVPVFVYGSSEALLEACGEYIWMTRATDKYNGKAVANYIANSLKCTNPAFIYSQTAFGDGYRAAVVSSLAELGIVCDESMMFGVNEEDTNFTNQIAQIQSSSADCLIGLGTNIAPYVIQQVADSGLELPCIGSGAFCNDTVFTQCGEAADGWICQAEWSVDMNDPWSEKFKATLMDLVGNLDTSSQACCYPSLYILKAACEKAGTTTDAKAINEAIKEVIVDSPIGIMKYNGDHSLATQSVMVEIKGGKPTPIETVLFRPVE